MVPVRIEIHYLMLYLNLNPYRTLDYSKYFPIWGLENFRVRFKNFLCQIHQGNPQHMPILDEKNAYIGSEQNILVTHK